jgi:hypothetical protein
MTERDCIATELERLLARVPESFEPKSSLPGEKARTIGKSATLRAAALSTGLALPRGASGMLTILPDLVAVWHIQTALIADIAACYGQSDKLDAQAMAYCLFKHMNEDLFVNWLLPTDKQLQFQPETNQMLGKLIQLVATRTAQRILGRVMGKWVPFISALGLGALTAYDTEKVGETARQFFAEAARQSADTEIAAS